MLADSPQLVGSDANVLANSRFFLSADTPIAASGSPIGHPLTPVSINPLENTTYTTRADGLPLLNSLPSAPVAIFFDVDGDTTTNVQPYDLDGNPTTFNAQEQNLIYQSWHDLAIYYAMFNVNVTTVQPNVSVTPTAWICWGINPYTTAGVSGVGVFPNTQPQSYAGGGFNLQVGDTLAHELGHNFGNWHTSEYDDLGNKIDEYSPALDLLHGPLMGGNPSHTPFSPINKWTIWHGGTNQQGQPDPGYILDNLAVIANALIPYTGGDGFRPDDFAGTAGSIAGATALTASGGGVTQSAVGVIERMTDVDTFSFTSAGGRYNIVAGRDVPSGVDLKMSIYDSNGTLIACQDGDPRATGHDGQ